MTPRRVILRLLGRGLLHGSVTVMRDDDSPPFEARELADIETCIAYAALAGELVIDLEAERTALRAEHDLRRRDIESATPGISRAGMLLIGAPAVTNVSLYPKRNFNFVRDIAPVASISRTAVVMVVNPAYPAKTVPEFIAYAKANPGKINFASGGNGIINHVAGELFKTMAGIDTLHVPYHGDFMPDVLGGRVTVAFSAIAQSIGDIRDGRLRALGVTSTMRQEILPDVPAVAEFVPGYDATAFYAIAAPKHTPAEIVNKLNREVNAALADPALKAKLLKFGSIVVTSSPADFEKFIAAEIDKWGKVIRAANIHPNQ